MYEYAVLKMVMLQSKCGTQEDFFEINILRLRKNWDFLYMCGNFTDERSEYFPESLLPLNLRIHWLLKIKLKLSMTWSLFKNI